MSSIRESIQMANGILQLKPLCGKTTVNMLTIHLKNTRIDKSAII